MERAAQASKILVPARPARGVSAAPFLLGAVSIGSAVLVADARGIPGSWGEKPGVEATLSSATTLVVLATVIGGAIMLVAFHGVARRVKPAPREIPLGTNDIGARSVFAVFTAALVAEVVLAALADDAQSLLAVFGGIYVAFALIMWIWGLRITRWESRHLKVLLFESPRVGSRQFYGESAQQLAKRARVAVLRSELERADFEATAPGVGIDFSAAVPKNQARRWLRAAIPDPSNGWLGFLGPWSALTVALVYVVFHAVSA